MVCVFQWGFVSFGISDEMEFIDTKNKPHHQSTVIINPNVLFFTAKTVFLFQFLSQPLHMCHAIHRHSLRIVGSGVAAPLHDHALKLVPDVSRASQVAGGNAIGLALVAGDGLHVPSA